MGIQAEHKYLDFIEERNNKVKQDIKLLEERLEELKKDDIQGNFLRDIIELKKSSKNSVSEKCVDEFLKAIELYNDFLFFSNEVKRYIEIASLYKEQLTELQKLNNK